MNFSFDTVVVYLKSGVKCKGADKSTYHEQSTGLGLVLEVRFQSKIE